MRFTSLAIAIILFEVCVFSGGIAFGETEVVPLKSNEELVARECVVVFFTALSKEGRVALLDLEGVAIWDVGECSYLILEGTYEAGHNKVFSILGDADKRCLKALYRANLYGKMGDQVEFLLSDFIAPPNTRGFLGLPEFVFLDKTILAVLPYSRFDGRRDGFFRVKITLGKKR